MKTLVALLSLLCCAALCAANPRPLRHPPRSLPLDSGATWYNLGVMARDAQAQDRDHETRLIPVIPKEKLQDGGMCCVNVKILKYYLNHILHHVNSSYSHIHLVRHDLRRVVQDLDSHCSSNLVGLEHFHTFTENLQKAGEKYESNAMVLNKAIGETDILFQYLYVTCRPLA